MKLRIFLITRHFYVVLRLLRGSGYLPQNGTLFSVSLMGGDIFPSWLYVYSTSKYSKYFPITNEFSGRLFTTSVSMSTHCATSRCRTRFVVLVGSSDNSLLSYEAAAAAFFMRVWAKAVAARQGQKHQPCKLIVCSLGGKRLQRRRSSVLPAKGVQGQLLYYVLFHTVTQCSKIW